MGTHASRTERKTDPNHINITERDVLVFLALHRFVILETVHLHAIVGGGRDGFRKRLRRLYDHGYVARPQIQNQLFRYADKRPTIYTLGKEGAEFLRVVKNLPIPENINWERKAQDRHGLRGQFKIHHDLGANGAVIALENALRAIKDVSV